jgi:hypothetical protein
MDSHTNIHEAEVLENGVAAVNNKYEMQKKEQIASVLNLHTHYINQAKLENTYMLQAKSFLQSKSLFLEFAYSEEMHHMRMEMTKYYNIIKWFGQRSLYEDDDIARIFLYEDPVLGTWKEGDTDRVHMRYLDDTEENLPVDGKKQTKAEKVTLAQRKSNIALTNVREEIQRKIKNIMNRTNSITRVKAQREFIILYSKCIGVFTTSKYNNKKEKEELGIVYEYCKATYLNTETVKEFFATAYLRKESLIEIRNYLNFYITKTENLKSLSPRKGKETLILYDLFAGENDITRKINQKKDPRLAALKEAYVKIDGKIGSKDHLLEIQSYMIRFIFLFYYEIFIEMNKEEH